MLTDTHCHLDFKDFDGDRDGVIDRAKAKGIARIINVGSSIEGSRRSIELAKKYDIVYASIGVHPHEANSVTDEVIEEFKVLSGRAPLRVPYTENKVVAIGEIGLDYYRLLRPGVYPEPLRFGGARNDENKESQKSAFKKFIKLAQELDLPLIIHSREADSDTMGILKEYERQIKGVMHCFSGDEKMLKECLDLGLYVSFTCNLTFKNAKNLREIAKITPIERILLETDAPFLAPEGERGKRNEPAYLTYLVDEWVKLTGLSKEDIERITTHNANKLFGLNLDEERSKIAYQIRDSLYLNITNTCTNNCDFCIRTQTAFVKGHNLRLDKEPSTEEILNTIGDPSKYKEIVFCGYGEPTTRLDAVKAVSKELKKKNVVTRLVTNGHGDLINSRPIAKELVGLIDNASVSLNTDKEETYNKICKPKFGPVSYGAVIKFIKDCIENNIKTEITCLNLAGVDLEACKKIAENLGASFRMRTYGVTG